MALSPSKFRLCPHTFLFCAFILEKLSILAQTWTFSLLLFSSCWLSLEGGLLYSFVGPAAAVVLVRILTLTSRSIVTRRLFAKALTTFFFFSFPNRWTWSLVFWSSTSWCPRTASPMWSWRREPGRSYWSSPHTGVSRLSPSSVPLQVYWWCALISSHTVKQREQRNRLPTATCVSTLSLIFVLFSPTRRASLWSSCVVLPLLALTWMSAVLAITDRRSALFQILFAVFDSLEGFIIVMVHCILRREVRQRNSGEMGIVGRLVFVVFTCYISGGLNAFAWIFPPSTN